MKEISQDIRGAQRMSKTHRKPFLEVMPSWRLNTKEESVTAKRCWQTKDTL